ncbi:MAG: metallophosphoesterase [Nitrospirae bacterium]|nr:metallophosphoesterase [Nitrospirota bacterium]
MVFLFFATLFITAHIYLLLKIMALFHPGISAGILISFAVFCLAASPLLVHIFYRSSGNHSRRVAMTSHMWAAFLILFLLPSVSFDLYNIALNSASFFFNTDYAGIAVSSVKAFAVSVLASMIFTAYGFHDAKNIRTERLTVQTGKLPAGVKRVRIFQISDLHLGIILGKEMLDKVIGIINAEKPDIIVSTGDLLNAEMDHIDSLSGELKVLAPPLGKYAVLGNHESYSGVDHAEKFIADSGFRLFRGEGVTVKDVINIAGVDDPAIRAMAPEEEKRPSESEILKGLKGGLFTLLLKHRPSVDEGSLGHFDLQLSGHTHKGQIFPVHLGILLFFPRYSGYYRLKNCSALYTSRGAGTAGPPVRFLAPPEVTVIDIVTA